MSRADVIAGDSGFCDDCGVTLDLHDVEGSCDYADHRARVLETFYGAFR